MTSLTGAPIFRAMLELVENDGTAVTSGRVREQKALTEPSRSGVEPEARSTLSFANSNSFAMVS